MSQHLTEQAKCPKCGTFLKHGPDFANLICEGNCGLRFYKSERTIAQWFDVEAWEAFVEGIEIGAKLGTYEGKPFFKVEPLLFRDSMVKVGRAVPVVVDGLRLNLGGDVWVNALRKDIDWNKDN